MNKSIKLKSIYSHRDRVVFLKALNGVLNMSKLKELELCVLNIL